MWIKLSTYPDQLIDRPLYVIGKDSSFDQTSSKKSQTVQTYFYESCNIQNKNEVGRFYLNDK